MDKALYDFIEEIKKLKKPNEDLEINYFHRTEINKVAHKIKINVTYGEKNESEMKTICQICYNKPIDAIFVTCGHAGFCHECALKCDKCPLCRGNISAVMKIYYS